MLWGRVWVLTHLFLFKVFNVSLFSFLLLLLLNTRSNYPYELNKDNEDSNSNDDVRIENVLFHNLQFDFELILNSTLPIGILDFPFINPLIKLLNWTWKLIVAEWNSSLNIVENDIKSVCAIVLFIKLNDKIWGKSWIVRGTCLFVR